MSDEKTGRTLGDALHSLFEWMGCLGLILLLGTCMGAWSLPFLPK